jgi:hypothetical protein
MHTLWSYVSRHHIAFLALFVALGGVSYAAVQLPKNSVGKPQLKRNAVVSAKVKDRSLLAKDFKRGQLPRGATGPAGAAGAVGATGPQGPKGDTGTVDLSNAGRVVNEVFRGGEVGATEGGMVTIIGSVEIDAPADGYVLVNVAAKLHPFAAVTGVCTASVGLRKDGATLPPTGLTTYVATDTSNAYRTVPLSHAVAVKAGPQTIETTLRINGAVSPGCDMQVMASNPGMTALWVPYQG